MPARKPSPFGQLLRHWRNARKRSQLDVALDAEISARHLSFVETGRSQPSREMVLLLSSVLEVPLCDRNALLHAAGFAPVYRQSDLDSPELAAVRRSIGFILESHNPYPSILLDRHWNLLEPNRSAAKLLPMFVAEPASIQPPVNSIRLLFDHRGFRPFVTNWTELAGALIQRLHREASVAADGDPIHELLAELLATDGVPANWRVPDLSATQPVIIGMNVRRGDIELDLFSTLTTLGTPLDITLQDLRLETFFPADEKSDRTLRQLAATS